MARVLYSGTRNASSWAFRAWLALRESDVAFDEHVVDIRHPARTANLADIGTFSPAAAVPVLVDGDTTIFDSLAIMEYANELGGGRLLPSDPKRRARARSLLAWQHAGLSNLCAKLSFESAFYPERRAMTAQENADTRRLFECWENELRANDGLYLSGELSLSDLAFVPTVLRILAHAPDGLSRYPLTRAWSARLLARATVREWLDQAERLPPVYLDGYAIA